VSPRADGTDGHLLKTLGGIRLTDAEDDAWIRDYALRSGQNVRKVVIAAIKHYRSFIENGETNPESEDPQ
jgi:hypothetical protein